MTRAVLGCVLAIVADDRWWGVLVAIGGAAVGQGPALGVRETPTRGPVEAELRPSGLTRAEAGEIWRHADRSRHRLVPIGLVIGLLLTVALAGAEGPRAERPTYTVGERWIRSDGVYDLIRIEDGRYIFAVDVDRQIHLTQDLMVAKAQQGLSVIEFTPPPKLTWPLEVGKWGTIWGTLRTPSFPAGRSVSI